MSAPSSDLPPSVRFLGIDRNRARFNPQLRAIVEEQDRQAAEAERARLEEEERRRSRQQTAAIKSEQEAKAKAREEAKEARREYADQLIKEQMEIAKKTEGAQSFYTTVVIDDPNDYKYDLNSSSKAGEVTIKSTSRGIRKDVPQVQYAAVYSDERLNLPFQSRIVNGKNIPIRIGDIIVKQTARAQRGQSSLYAARTVYDMDAVRAQLDGYRSAPPQGQRHYLVNLEDSLSGPKQYYYDPIHPFKISDNPADIYPPKEITGSKIEDPSYIAGFSAVFENVANIGTDVSNKLLGNRKDNPYKPELEADLMSTGLSGLRDVAEGRGTSRLETDVRLIGQDILTYPAYYAGSIGGSIVLGAATLGIGPLAKAGVSAFRFLTASRALKPLGNIARVERDLINIGTEADPFRYSVGRVTTVRGKPSVEFFMRQTATSAEDFIQPLTKTTQYVGSELAGTREGLLNIPKSKQLFEVKKGQINIPEIGGGARGETLYRIAKPEYKAVATSETYTIRELEAMLTSPEGLKKFLGVPKDFELTRFPASTQPPARPFTGMGSRQNVTAQYLRDVGVLPSAAAKGAPFGAMAIGVETAASASREAVRETSRAYETPGIMGGIRSKVQYEDAMQFYNTPAQSPFSGTKARPTTTTESVRKTEAAIYNSLVYGPTAKTGFKLEPLRGLETTPFFFPIESPLMSPLVTPVTTPSTTPRTTPLTTPITTPIPDVPTIPKPPKIPPVLFPPVGETTRTKRRKLDYRAYQKGLTIWKVPPLLKINSGNLDKIFGLSPKRRGKRT